MHTFPPSRLTRPPTSLGTRIGLIAAAMAIGAISASAQSLTGVGVLPGASSSLAEGVSADGSTVVGWSNFPGGVRRAFRWTRGGGIEELVPLDFAVDTNADGTVILGGAAGRAYLWTGPNQIQDLGTLPGAYEMLPAAISDDGTVVVGSATFGGPFPYTRRAFRWTSAGGMQDLGLLPGHQWCAAFDISGDGTVIVGECGYPSRSWRWTSSGGMESLGLMAGVHGVQAQAANEDGSMIVGTSFSATNPSPAFRWSSAGGMENLGVLQFFAAALGISADGSVVVGESRCDITAIRCACIWTSSAVPVHLSAHFANVGIGVTGWTFRTATGISADGRTIVGSGQHFQSYQGWVAVLSSEVCYPNCDASTVQPVLNVDDFTCFINSYAAAQALPHAMQVEHYANCDGSTTAPALTIQDFTCFINHYAAGCP